MDKDGRQKPNPDAWREHASEYERGFIDGMQEQIKRSVDRAVNALADKREWVGLTDEGLEEVFPAIATYHPANKTLYRSIARAIEAKLKEKNSD
jgi:hypothetical protein